MEDVIIVLLAFAWLMYSLYKGSSKKSSQQKQTTQPQEQSTEAQPKRGRKERDFDTIFREMLGEEDVATKSQSETEAIAETSEKAEMQEELSQEQQAAEKKRYKGITGVDEDYQFSSEGEIETIEDQVEKQKKEKDKVLEVVELWDDDKRQEPLDVDWRRAIIYSEILKTKF